MVAVEWEKTDKRMAHKDADVVRVMSLVSTPGTDGTKKVRWHEMDDLPWGKNVVPIRYRMSVKS